MIHLPNSKEETLKYIANHPDEIIEFFGYIKHIPNTIKKYLADNQKVTKDIKLHPDSTFNFILKYSDEVIKSSVNYFL